MSKPTAMALSLTGAAILGKPNQIARPSKIIATGISRNENLCSNTQRSEGR